MARAVVFASITEGGVSQSPFDIDDNANNNNNNTKTNNASNNNNNNNNNANSGSGGGGHLGLGVGSGSFQHAKSAQHSSLRRSTSLTSKGASSGAFARLLEGKRVGKGSSTARRQG
jgi:hypothetical protein